MIKHPFFIPGVLAIAGTILSMLSYYVYNFEVTWLNYVGMLIYSSAILYVPLSAIYHGVKRWLQ